MSENTEFISAWTEVQREVMKINTANGFYDPELHDAVRVALIHSELSECLEGLRHGNPASDHIPLYSAAEEELADVIIRVMDFAETRGLRVAQAVLEKIEFNRGRSYRHGGKVF